MVIFLVMRNSQLHISSFKRTILPDFLDYFMVTAENPLWNFFDFDFFYKIHKTLKKTHTMVINTKQTYGIVITKKFFDGAGIINNTVILYWKKLLDNFEHFQLLVF